MRTYLLPSMAIIIIAVTVTACSRINLAYRNLDTLIPWTLNDYLDMDRDQRQHLKAHLREHLDWHCRTQLPSYLDSLQQLRQQIASEQVDTHVLRDHYRQARQAMHEIATQITPTSIELLRKLDDRQVEELAKGFEEDRREREEKYLEPEPAQQIRARAERMQERIENWFGSANAAQRQRILTWAHALGGQNQLWLENRAQWQQSFLDAVRQRHETGFETRMTRLLQDRDSFWSNEYRLAFESAERVGIELFSDLYALSDRSQRQHLTDRLHQLEKNLGTLECLPQTAAR